jgi:hypothetical protein
MPFGFHLTVDTLPSGELQSVASGSPWLCPTFVFHSDLLDFRGIEPELQLLKIAPVSSEFLLTHLALLAGLIHQHAGGDEVLMYVNAATAAVNYFHNSSFAAERGTKDKKEYPSRALCLGGTGSTALFHDTSRARFMNGL